MIPEFIGRLPVIGALGPLDKTTLVKVLTEPRNALCRQYSKMFELAGSSLEFTEDSLEAIADKALQRDTGARALRGVVEELMLDIMFHLPEPGMAGHYVINEAIVRGEERARPARERLRKESA